MLRKLRLKQKKWFSSEKNKYKKTLKASLFTILRGIFQLNFQHYMGKNILKIDFHPKF